jgi:SAM-dependent methyltransferase
MDDATLQFYRDNAQSYADWVKAPSARLIRFMSLLPAGGEVLELGCGAGNHSAAMLAAGFVVRSTDGSPEMAEVASRRLGQPVETMLFHELDAHEAYDGIWASACLLHAPRDELWGILGRIHRALNQRACSTQASRPAIMMAATTSGATTIMRRANGLRRPTPEQAAGNPSRPTPARSKVLMASPQPCCI